MATLDAWLEHISAQHWQTIDMGLSRMCQMVERLSLSQPAPKIITVAGTNGKGSTSVACEALLMATGLKVGTTLSPHLHHFNERIRIDGQPLEDAPICAAFAAVEAVRGELALTYFEFAALAAFWCFQQAQVDVAILEIGLGGRLDAFNVIDADIAVITSIGLDHQQFLGDTLAEIGAEKAGILRPEQQVVLGADMPPSVLDACCALGLEPLQVGQEYELDIDPDSASWSILHNGEPFITRLPLASSAPHNLLLAFLAARALVPVSIDVLRSLSAEPGLPGRLQSRWRDERQWIFDVAHNPAGARFLCEQLRIRELTPAAFVCGMLRDKDHCEVHSIVAPVSAGPWFLIDTEGARGCRGVELNVAPLGSEEHYNPTMENLVAEVNSVTEPGDVILVFGSFNVIEQFDIVYE